MVRFSSQRLIAASVVFVVAGMVGMSYASVPLYRLFCAATGYNGTTQVAPAGSQAMGQRTLNVRFDSNVDAGLNWTFAPEATSINVRTGQTMTAYFKVTNRATKSVTGIARYNVSPDAAGAYFDKVSCFCFSELTLEPGESMDLPVVFFLDPALEREELLKDVSGVTLSYTFFAVKAAPVASSGAAPKKL